ncbi:haloacid dehalogenase-like hydrolase [Kitasatospora sp. NPDC127067]|uniref:haloacid dehalogenase-like hydrolase n=1 Tax=Kitasatospora sp. NPDC127067 TaxID=3347126 RepID=UPI003657578D
MRATRPALTAIALTTVLATGAPALAAPSPASAPPAAAANCPILDTRLSWYGDNRQKLQEFIDASGGCTHPGAHPLALFDWDNTLVKNDVGDATMSWLLRNDKILQPAGQDWSTTSRYLTAEATTALGKACGDAATAGSPLPTSTNAGCAAEILSVYGEHVTTGGAAAFAGFDHRRINPAYAWGAQLLAGHTLDEVAAYARQARAESLAASPSDAAQAVRTVWVRYYEHMRDLVGTLRRAGFDVGVVSASPEPVVRVWAEDLGFAADEVIGIRNKTESGRLTAHLADCGAAPADSVITYIDGKRCFVNQDILGIQGQAAFQRAPEAERQALAAGDSTTDVTFVGDATGLRLAINRQAAELMCHAYRNEDGKWLVNPMFIDPLSALPCRYPCSTTAYTGPDGTPGPVRDDAGDVIPDQVDAVH